MESAKKVTKIEPKKVTQKKASQKLRVAAYCRVSTDNEEQLESLESQIEAFNYQMKLHSDWELVKIYADEGITGTSVKKRTKFNEMMEDCKAGKIDRIITKSISRFARNTLDCIKYVRELKDMGVHILFEKEGIDTSTAVSEMILTIMASFAQEESRSISENLKWGIRKRFEEGIEVKVPLYGYTHTDKELYQIVPEEAKIVREIFERYAHGENPLDIMADMVRRGAMSPGGNKKWNRLQFDRMLKNEKYTGDVILQKTYIKDHLTHKQVVNDGVLSKYYIEDAHPAIIDKHLFEQVQKIEKMGNVKDGNSMYPYGEMLKCPKCGRTLAHGTLNNFFYKKKNIIGGGWGCYRDGGCRSYLLLQCVLDEALIDAYREKYGTVMDSVEFYWIDDSMEEIIPGEDKVTIKWRDGEITEKKLDFDKNNYLPSNYAVFYNRFLTRIKNGEIKTHKKNLMGLKETRI